MYDLMLFVPTYNCLTYTKQLYAFTSPPKNTLWYFFDNASTDGSREYLERKGQRKDVWVSIHARNQGVAASWNCGLNYAFNEAKIPYVAILNNDSILHREALGLMVEVLKAGKYHFVSATDKAGKVARAQNIVDFPVPKKEVFEEAPDFSCFMMDKIAYDTIGPFDDKFFPAYFEDNDYHWRARIKGMPLVLYNRAMYYHFGSRTLKENADIEVQVSETFLVNEAYYIKKWGGKPGKEVFEIPFGGKSE